MTPPDQSTGRSAYRVSASTRAPVDTVWPLVGEARRWSEWSFLTDTRLEREASPVPDGVGAIRKFTRFGVGSREEVVAWDPPGHLAYRILSGFPVRNYRADVTLTADGTGTRIEWAGTYDPKWPGTGRILAKVLPSMMQRFADGLAAHADGLAGGR
jgi:Polyketide cyclase / dehydrase and lipid transport